MGRVILTPHEDGAALFIKGMSDAEFATYREAVAGGRYDKTRRATIVSDLGRLASSVRRLRKANIAVVGDRSVLERLTRFEADRWIDLKSAQDRIAEVEADLRTRGHQLRPYQAPAIEWIATRFAGLLADDPGLGKSAMLLLGAPAGAPMLAVVPAAARAVWERLEPAKWRPSLEIRPLHGRGSFAWPEPGQLVVTNYDILPRLHVDGCPRKIPAECDGCVPDVSGGHYPNCTRTRMPTICAGCSGEVPPCPTGVYAVFDEAHAAKNPKSLRGESVAALSALVLARGGRSFPATGTPLLNRPQELWDVLKVFGLETEAFASYSEFARMMGGEPNIIEIYDRKSHVKVPTVKGWKFPTNPEDPGLSPEVADRLQRVMLRRRVEEVAQDLPKKSRRILQVDVGPSALQKCDKFLETLGGPQASVHVLEKLIEGGRDGLPFELWTKIRSALATAKVKASIDVIAEYEEQGEPVVFFSMFKAPVEKVGAREGWETITGSTSKKERGRIVDAFQAGHLKGLAGTVGAIGVAVTLTRARFVVFNDRDVSPSINRQAEDRVSRIGQKRPVLVTVLAANHPLDVRIEEILERKTRLIEGSVDAAAQGREEKGS